MKTGCIQELLSEATFIEQSWGLDKCIIFDPTDQASRASLTLHDLLEITGRGPNYRFNIFEHPWPFSLAQFPFPASHSSDSWRIQFTQHPNLLHLSNQSTEMLLFAFQDKLDHFKAMLNLALLWPNDEESGGGVLAISLPCWSGRLTHWKKNFATTLAEHLTAPVDNIHARKSLGSELRLLGKAILDTSFPGNHPGNFWMNDLGPAMAAYDIAVNSSDTIQISRLRTGWLDDIDPCSLIAGRANSLDSLSYLNSRDDITDYASANNKGLIRLWGSSVSPVLSHRCRHLLHTRYASLTAEARHSGTVIGIGLRGFDRILINLDEILTQIISGPTQPKGKVKLVFHGSSANPIYTKNQSYFESELRIATELADIASRHNVSSAITVGQPLFSQLAHLCHATLDICPIGTTELKSLFMLDIPMIVHSPIGRQPIPHRPDPWQTNGDFTYTNIYRGHPHSVSVLTPKGFIKDIVVPTGVTNPGHYNYALHAEMMSTLFTGFYAGLQQTTCNH